METQPGNYLNPCTRIQTAMQNVPGRFRETGGMNGTIGMAGTGNEYMELGEVGAKGAAKI